MIRALPVAVVLALWSAVFAACSADHGDRLPFGLATVTTGLPEGCAITPRRSRTPAGQCGWVFGLEDPPAPLGAPR